MKKLLIIVLMIFIFTGCNKKYNTYEEINYSSYTYHFTGKSNHFAFVTGTAYYGENNDRSLTITNFKIIDKLKNEKDIKSYSLSVSFNGNELFSNEEMELNKSFEEYINNIKIEEYGQYTEYGESDAFFETSVNEFKKNLEIKIKYCYKNETCNIENFDIQYMN